MIGVTLVMTLVIPKMMAGIGIALLHLLFDCCWQDQEALQELQNPGGSSAPKEVIG